jgi:hypothetical protein
MHRFLIICLLAVPALGQTADERKQAQEEIQQLGLTDAAVSKLSGDQIHDLLLHRYKNEPPAVASIAVVGTFATMTLVVFGVLFAIYRIYRQRSETLRLMVEKGIAIPPELIAPRSRPANDLRRGLVSVGLGVGLSICLAVMGEHGSWTIGLVPLLVGVGYIVSWRLTREDSEPPRANGISSSHTASSSTVA